jgi:hypothetical protein
MHTNGELAMLRRLLFLTLCFYAFSLHAAQPRLLTFDLEDYSKARYLATMWSGRPLILFLADKKGSDYDKNYVWTLRLTSLVRGHPPASNAAFASIADLRAAPRLARGFLRGSFQPKAQDPVGLTLLDWNGDFFKTYNLEPGVLHMLVFDREHTLVYQVALRDFDAAQLATVQNALKSAWPLKQGG